VNRPKKRAVDAAIKAFIKIVIFLVKFVNNRAIFSVPFFQDSTLNCQITHLNKVFSA